MALGVALMLAEACAPRVTPLQGAPAPNRTLPPIPIAGTHRHVVFRWDYEENSLMAHGEGSIRASAPDSARVDLFLAGGVPAGHAILIGDSLRGPNTATGAESSAAAANDVGDARTTCGAGAS